MIRKTWSCKERNFRSIVTKKVYYIVKFISMTKSEKGLYTFTRYTSMTKSGEDCVGSLNCHD